MSRFGTQPARAVLVERRLTVSAVALAINVTYPHLFSALSGNSRPNETVRVRLPAYLALPLEECFTAEILALPNGAGRGGDRRSALFLKGGAA